MSRTAHAAGDGKIRCGGLFLVFEDEERSRFVINIFPIDILPRRSAALFDRLRGSHWPQDDRGMIGPAHFPCMGVSPPQVCAVARRRTDSSPIRRRSRPEGGLGRGSLSARERLGDMVFMFTHGQIGNLRYSLESIARISGVKFMAHDLRRTFATVAESLDIPTYALRALLNHKGGSDVTGGYLIITTERLRSPMEKIEDFVLKAAGIRASADVVALSQAF